MKNGLSFQRWGQILVAILICLSGTLYGQVSIQPLYQAKEIFVIDHLFKFNVLNTSQQAINGYLEINIEDNQRQRIATITSQATNLAPGQLLRETDLTWASGLQLGFGEFSRILQQSGRLPFGNYMFCYQFIEGGSGRAIGVNCQEKQVKIYGLPELISPMDGAALATIYPQLSWKPPLPLSGPEVSYSLRLVALKKGQSPIQAIATNFPLLDMRYLKQNLLPYPPSGIPLDAQRTYAWQITAYFGNLEIGKTEIWTFHFGKAKNEKMAASPPKSFPFVQAQLGGSFYTAENDLCFAYNNRSYDGQLNYEIRESGNSGGQLNALPTVNLRPGLNYIQIDQQDLSGIIDGEVYLLKITDQKGKKYFMEFEYTNQP